MDEIPMPDDAAEDSPYEPPAIVALGTLEELTRGFGGAQTDGFGEVPGSQPT